MHLVHVLWQTASAPFRVEEEPQRDQVCRLRSRRSLGDDYCLLTARVNVPG